VELRIARMAITDTLRMRARLMATTALTGLWAAFSLAQARGSMVLGG
jgi:hypothetical protein